MAGSCSFQNGHYKNATNDCNCLFHQLAVLSSEFIQLPGLLYLFLLQRKRNNDFLVTHFVRKRKLIVKRCKELKLRQQQ